MLYTLRYHLGEHDAAVRQYVADHGEHFIVCHGADADDERPHWHAIFYSEKTPSALRNHLMYTLKLKKGNGQYSLKPVKDKEIFERYMCHGDGDGAIVHVVSAQAPITEPTKYSADWCAERNREFYAKRKEFQRDAKKERKSIIDDCVDRCREMPQVSRERCARLLLEVYKERRAPMNTFQMRAQLNTILSLLNCKDAEEEIINSILERV